MSSITNNYNKRKWHKCFIKFNDLSETIETWELYLVFHSVPIQFYKTTESRHGLQLRENQMKYAPFATAVKWKFEC